MVGILILTHGGLAEELLAAAKTIAGDLEGFEALALSWVDSIDEVEAQVGAALERLDHGDGVLVLTDVFGGTPSNVAKRFQEVRQIEAVAGVNLPMVLRLGCLSKQANGHSMSLSELASWIRDKGRESICSESVTTVKAKKKAAKKVESISDR